MLESLNDSSKEVMRANGGHTPFFTTEDPEIHGCTEACSTGTVT